MSSQAQTTECNDGLICENFAPCIPHPIKESKFMCDCSLAKTTSSSNLNKFAGVYCEHQATSMCHTNASPRAIIITDHSFCTNGGECKLMVGEREEHAGCKCPRGYEGDYCQFVQGSRPSDWDVSDFMHPALVNAYSGSEHAGVALGFVIGLGFGFILLMCLLGLCFQFSGMRERLRKNEKEMDTAENNGSNNIIDSTGVVLGGRVTSPQNAEFVGGKSVYKKKTSTGNFVTTDTLEADGGVLTEALEDQNPSLEEVDLDDDKLKGELT